jgi:hypothetical protein
MGAVSSAPRAMVSAKADTERNAAMTASMSICFMANPFSIIAVVFATRMRNIIPRLFLCETIESKVAAAEN